VTEEAGYLVVRAGALLVGLPLTRVIEVLDPGSAFPVPAREAAVRGVTLVRDRITPLVHLGTLLQGGACPPERGEVGVVVDLAGRRVCLEVEAAETILYRAGLKLAPGTGLPCADAVARTDAGLVPLLDFVALGCRIMESAAA
jgi:chemotaxis signal transduction protein